MKRLEILLSSCGQRGVFRLQDSNSHEYKAVIRGYFCKGTICLVCLLFLSSSPGSLESIRVILTYWGESRGRTSGAEIEDAEKKKKKKERTKRVSAPNIRSSVKLTKNATFAINSMW